MAADSQVITIGDASQTLNFTTLDYIMLEGGGSGIRPFAQMVFRGNWTLDGSGVGDTADCRVTMPLPTNVVWQLDQFFVQINGDSYDNGLLILFYAPSTTAFGDSTELRYSLALTQPSDISVASRSNQFMLATNMRGSAGGTDIEACVLNQDPYRIISFQDESGGADPVIHISGGLTTNITSGNVARLSVAFLGYTYEQMRSGLLHAGLSDRG